MESFMKFHLLLITLIPLYSFWGCTTSSKPYPTSGTIEIIYSEGDDIVTGFLFEEGISFTLAERPNTIPDFKVHIHHSESKVEGLYLAEPDLEPAFVLFSNAATADSANYCFNTLSIFPDTTLTELALPLNKNQVWGVQTKKEHFAKILIKDVWATADTSSSNTITHSGSLTMKWQYQPDGSREF
jgi:hypothetical protein